MVRNSYLKYVIFNVPVKNRNRMFPHKKFYCNKKHINYVVKFHFEKGKKNAYKLTQDMM